MSRSNSHYRIFDALTKRTFRPILGLSLLLALCTSISAFSQSAPITVDGLFDDWSGGLTTAIDSPETISGIDLLEMSVTNDAEFLYVKITTDSPFDLTDNLVNQEIRLYIDTDSDETTGWPIQQGYGAELGIVFLEHFAHYNVEPYVQVSLSDISLRAAPTVTSNEFEIAIKRDAIPDGINSLFTAQTIHLVLLNNTNDDRLPNVGETFSYTFNDSPVEPYIPIDIFKQSSDHVRTLVYNTLGSGLNNNQRRPHFENIISILKPDIIGFSECGNTDASFVKELLDEWIPLVDQNGWYVEKKPGGDLITASRWEILETWDDLTKQFPVLIDLPENNASDLLFTNAHLSCCANDEGRQEQADEYIAFVLDAKSEGGTITLPFETPMVYGGDLNLVGFAQQIETLLTGEIQDEVTYGEGGMPDWDDTPMSDQMTLQTDIAMDYTWRNDEGNYPPGKLDYILYSDAVMDLEKAFVIQTEVMTTERLELYGFNQDDTSIASDHFPVVGDFAVAQATSVDEFVDSSHAVFPNPVVNELSINLANRGVYTVQLVDVFGQQIGENHSGSGRMSLDLSHLSAGVYFVLIEAENEVVEKHRVLKL